MVCSSAYHKQIEETVTSMHMLPLNYSPSSTDSQECIKMEQNLTYKAATQCCGTPSPRVE